MAGDGPERQGGAPTAAAHGEAIELAAARLAPLVRLSSCAEGGQQYGVFKKLSAGMTAIYFKSEPPI